MNETVRDLRVLTLQKEEVEYLREKMKKQDQDRDRVIDKGLMARELEATREQAGAARSIVEVTMQNVNPYIRRDCVPGCTRSLA